MSEFNNHMTQELSVPTKCNRYDEVSGNCLALSFKGPGYSGHTSPWPLRWILNEKKSRVRNINIQQCPFYGELDSEGCTVDEEFTNAEKSERPGGWPTDSRIRGAMKRMEAKTGLVFERPRVHTIRLYE